MKKGWDTWRTYFTHERNTGTRHVGTWGKEGGYTERETEAAKYPGSWIVA